MPAIQSKQLVERWWINLYDNIEPAKERLDLNAELAKENRKEYQKEYDKKYRKTDKGKKNCRKASIKYQKTDRYKAYQMKYRRAHRRKNGRDSNQLRSIRENKAEG